MCTAAKENHFIMDFSYLTSVYCGSIRLHNPSLNQNYGDKEIVTKTDMKNLLLLLTKYVHLNFVNYIYFEKDGFILGSFLVPC